jgi:seryl-tRNA synthetase
MLEIQRIRAEKEAILAGLQKRNINVQETIEAILSKDSEWSSTKTESDLISS